MNQKGKHRYMTLEMDQEELGVLCVCAIRYCQGRETYMPSLVQEIVKSMLSQLSDKDIDVMIQDCDYQRRFDLYGDVRVDKPGWLAWEQELLKEQKRRKEQDGRTV